MRPAHGLMLRRSAGAKKGPRSYTAAGPEPTRCTDAPNTHKELLTMIRNPAKTLCALAAAILGVAAAPAHAGKTLDAIKARG